MAGWNNVDVNFEEETANFGPRMESGSALCQVKTTATITHNGELTKNPHICGVAMEENLVVAIDAHLSVFENSCHTFLVTKDFGAEVDALSLTEDGNLLVAGLRSGTICFYHFGLQMMIFSKKLVDSPNSDNKVFEHIAFTPISHGGFSDLVIVTSRQVHIIKEFNVKALHEALTSGDTERAQSLQRQIHYDVIDSSTEHTDWTLYAVAGLGHYDLLTAGGGNSGLCLWEKIDDEYHAVRSMPAIGDIPIRKCIPMRRENILCLDVQGVLSIINMQLLIVLKQWENKVIKDFSVMETGDQNNSSLTDLKVILLEAASDGSTTLEICELSTMKTMYSLVLNPWTFLVQTKSQEEAIYVLEGVTDEMSNSDIVSTVRIRCLTEAQPEDRLCRLIQKGHFEEAENFARMFQQDIELVYKPKASYLFSQLSPWNVRKLTTNQITEYTQQIQACLDLIQDDIYVVQCCTTAALPTYQSTLDLLTYAKQRLVKKASLRKTSDINKSNIGRLLTQTMEMLYRLKTYQVAYTEEKFNRQSWSVFQQVSMLKEVMSQLQDNCIQTAIILWNRHQMEFANEFNADKLRDVLNCIPEQTPSVELKYWLKNEFIPYIIRKAPDGLPLMAGWIEQKARSMEIYEKEHWPANSLEFSRLLQNSCISLSHSTHESGFSTPEELATLTVNLPDAYFHMKNRKTNTNSDDVWETETDPCPSLSTLIDQLSDLLRLHTKYRCKLSLAEYVVETTDSLVYRMLDRVAAVELIPSSIKQFVRPYMKEHKLNEDQILVQYIGDLAKYHRKSKKSIKGHRYRENRAIAIIRCIQEISYKLQGILDLMKIAYVPWSTDIETLVQEGLASDHPSAAALRESYSLIEAQEVLLKYDVGNFNIRDGFKTEQLLQFILKQDRPTALNDALEVAKQMTNYDKSNLYVFRLQFLIMNDRLDEAFSLIKSLPEDMALECGKRIFTFTTVHLNDTLVFNEEDEKMKKNMKQNLTYATCQILKLLLSRSLDMFDMEDLQMKYDRLRTIHNMQVEFGSFLTYEDVCQKTHLVQDYMIRFYQKDPTLLTTTRTQDKSGRKQPPKTDFSYPKMLRLGEILGISRTMLRSQIGLVAASDGQIQLVLDKSKELFNDLPNEEVASMLYEIAHALCQYMSTQTDKQDLIIPSLHSDILNMARLAVTYCHPSMIQDYVALSSSLSKAKDVLRNCERGDYGATVQDVADDNANFSSKDLYREWCGDDFFQENGFVMDSTLATHLVYQQCVASAPKREPGLLPYLQGILKKGDSISTLMEGLNQSTTELTDYLSQNEHVELALAYVTDLLRCHLINYTTLCLNNSKNVELPEEELKENQEAILEMKKSRKEMIIALLKKAIKKSRMDHNLILGYLADIEQPMSFDILAKTSKRISHQYKTCLAVGRLGKDLSRLTADVNMLRFWKEYTLNSEWGLKLSKLKIPCKELFRGAARKVLPMLSCNKNVTIRIIKDFCSAYSLVQEDAILVYLNSVLLPTNKAGEIINVVETKDFVLSEVVTKNFEEAIHELRHLDIVNTLQTIVKKIDLYDYDRIECVLTALHNLSPTEETTMSLQLINKLRKYERVAPPSEFETTYNTMSEKNVAHEQVIHYSAGKCLSPLSTKRLPLHPLIQGNEWKIISPELNAKTIDLLWPIATLLKLPSSTLYMTTVRNIVTEHIKMKSLATDASTDLSNQDKFKCEWTLDKATEETFFPTIVSLLEKIPAPSDAMACCDWIMKQLPMGAEKVAVLKMCVDFAERWMLGCDQNNPEERKSSKNKYECYAICYKRLSVEQVLLQHGLGEELLDMSDSFVKLIFKLYEHPSIQQRFNPGVVVDSLPDIHKVTDEIASICDLHIKQIRLNLIEKWLPSTHQDDTDVTLNMTDINMDITMKSEEEEMTQEDMNLKRVIYLLQQMALKSGVLFLLNYLSDKDSSKINSMCFVRAVRCLFSLTDNPTIQAMLNKPINFLELLKKHIYMVKLERLHMQQTLENFTKCNKEGLVRGIWIHHSHDKNAVKLVAELCLDYKVHDVQLWNNVIQQLLSFQMIDYLLHVMVRLSYYPELWKVPSYHRTWSKLLLMPLSAGASPLDKDQLEECLVSYSLIHRYPLIHELDLQGFSKHFLKVDLPTCALGCLLLIDDNDVRSKLVNNLLQGEGEVKIIFNQLRDWSDKQKILPRMQQVEHAVFAYIDKTKTYNELYNTGFEMQFSEHLANEDAITNLLAFLVKHERLPEASQLLYLYERIQMQSEYSIAVKDIEGNTDKIQKYLELHNLIDLMEYLPSDTEEEED